MVLQTGKLSDAKRTFFSPVAAMLTGWYSPSEFLYRRNIGREETSQGIER
jgi:hypothetical protein